ncbi:MAG: ABC transporter permease [Blastocatellia bacterium]|nr:ABC transporter permease [Blastocatellia bacterium]
MRLAWRNLSHDRLRFAVTIIGIAFAVFLMVFQGSLLTGFLRAAASGINATDGDIWIVARGVQCFEFATPLPKRFREISMGVPGVESASRMAVGFAVWRKPSGMSQLVLLVGAESGVGPRFPIPYINPNTTAAIPDAILVDRSNAFSLESVTVPVSLEVNQRRAKTVEIIDGFGSFFGAPYVFTSYADATRYLDVPQEETFYIIVKVANGYDVKTVQRELTARLPDADVLTREEFARRSQLFWVIKTGAGGALLLAALLAWLVGLVIVSQNIYATTMENLEEYATLKAIGAPRRYIRGVVLTQALVSGVIGSCAGLIAVFPAADAITEMISWIYTPWWLPVMMIGVGLLMCCLASIVSIRKALSVEPARVFRA